MCGIAGYIDFHKRSDDNLIKIMVNTLSHRGPDDLGTEVFKEINCTIGFGQSRLSIIDLSQRGHQPMHFKHLTIVFNGEIYNYHEIKEKLRALGHKFESDSDTEVILHAFIEWGDAAIQQFIGMFAFALYDKKQNIIKCFRDRSGVKPFYYWFKGGLFLFGSELKALMAHPQFEKEIEISVLPDYLHFGYIPAPYSIFKHCFKLNPGHMLELNLITNEIDVSAYWNVLDYYRQPKLTLSYIEAKAELQQLLSSAFSYRMIADVPVGVFLSGGYDSTAVTAILQSEMSAQLQTFTIGFEEGNNEAPYAAETAKYLGTNHTEYICTTQEAQSIIPELPYYYDEPFGDSSAIPTTLVSRIARSSVTVALSADGGDEVFCGYNSYFKLNRLSQQLNKIPSTLRSVLTKLSPAIKSIGAGTLNTAMFHKAASAFEALNANERKQIQRLFQRMNEKPGSYIQSFFKYPVLASSSPFSIDESLFAQPLEIAMAVDYRSYLQNDILTKVDRATMSVSLEGREPLLDHRIIEFAARLPLEYKFDGQNNGKRILKDIVHDYVPYRMMDRPKSGFSLPIYTWLKGDLSHLLDEYLSEDAIAWSGLWNIPFVSKQVQAFRDNKLHYSSLIWYLLMFQMWWKKWMDK